MARRNRLTRCSVRRREIDSTAPPRKHLFDMDDMFRLTFESTAWADSLPGILYTSRPDGSLDYVNRRFCDYTGMADGSANGFGWLAALHPEDRAQAVARWRSGAIAGQTFELDFRLRRSDGQYRWFRSHLEPQQHEGAIVGWVGLTSDIHDLREAHADLEQRTRTLQAANDELQRFAYAVSHDLQSPLRTIRSMAELLARRVTLAPDTRSLVEFIVSAVERTSLLIADLLSYSRTASTVRSLTEISADQMVEWALADLHASIEDSRAQVKVDGPLPRVLADDQLSRVFQNLIGNAIKYRGERTPDIRITADLIDGFCTFAVQDNGIGIDMSQADAIFGAFRRLHGPQTYEGTGIGLAIAKSIVEHYGGSIWVESVPGTGSTFYFTVPAAEERLGASG